MTQQIKGQFDADQTSRSTGPDPDSLFAAPAQLIKRQWHQQQCSPALPSHSKERHNQAFDDCPLVFELDCDDSVMVPALDDRCYASPHNSDLPRATCCKLSCGRASAACGAETGLLAASLPCHHVCEQAAAKSGSWPEPQEQGQHSIQVQSPCSGLVNTAAADSVGFCSDAARSNTTSALQSCSQEDPVETSMHTYTDVFSRLNTTDSSVAVSHCSPQQTDSASLAHMDEDGLCCSMVFADVDDTTLPEATPELKMHTCTDADTLQPETAHTCCEPAQQDTTCISGADCINSPSAFGNSYQLHMEAEQAIHFPEHDNHCSPKLQGCQQNMNCNVQAAHAEFAPTYDNSSLIRQGSKHTSHPDHDSSHSQIPAQPEHTQSQLADDSMACSPDPVCSLIFCDSESADRDTTAECHMCWADSADEGQDAVPASTAWQPHSGMESPQAMRCSLRQVGLDRCTCLCSWQEWMQCNALLCNDARKHASTVLFVQLHELIAGSCRCMSVALAPCT